MAGWSGLPQEHDFKPLFSVEAAVEPRGGVPPTTTTIADLRAAWEYEVRVRAVTAIGKVEKLVYP